MVMRRVRQATISDGPRFPKDTRPPSAASAAQLSPWLEYKRRRDELSRPAAPEEPWRLRPSGALSFNPPKTQPLRRPYEIKSRSLRALAAEAEMRESADPQAKYALVVKRAPAAAFAPPPGAEAAQRKRTRADDHADAAEAHRRVLFPTLCSAPCFS